MGKYDTTNEFSSFLVTLCSIPRRFIFIDFMESEIFDILEEMFRDGIFKGKSKDEIHDIIMVTGKDTQIYDIVHGTNIDSEKQIDLLEEITIFAYCQVTHWMNRTI